MIRELSKQDPQLKCMSSKVCVSQLQIQDNLTFKTINGLKNIRI